MRRVRAVSNGNILEVVDGEPQSSGQISRAMVDSLGGYGVFEPVADAPVTPPRERALSAPEAPLLTAAHTDPPQPARGRRNARKPAR